MAREGERKDKCENIQMFEKATNISLKTDNSQINHC